MMKYSRLIFKTTLLFAFLFLNANFSFAQKRNKNTAKAQPVQMSDREFAYKTLYRIAYPVVHNLANETLVMNMPLETGPNYYLKVKNVTYLEAVGRTVSGIAPWLALPDDNTEEGLLRKSMREETLKGLKNAVNPQSPDYLNFKIESQPIVDAAYIALAFIRAPQALWDPLDNETKSRFVTEFKSLRTRKCPYNNWLLFSGLTEAFLLKIGEQYDPARIDFGFRKMKEWYAGDGWYSDGEKFSMDNYNSYVIHPMMVEMVKIMADKKLVKIDEYNSALQRMVRYSEFSERLISPTGTYAPFGRSITYRTAAFQALAQVALMEKLPSYINPSQVRAGLLAVFHNMYEGNQNFDDKGWLVLGFNGHQPEVADQYTSTGSLYMATLGFLILGLPADNKFWTDPATDWTSKKAWSGQSFKKDYKVEY